MKVGDLLCWIGVSSLVAHAVGEKPLLAVGRTDVPPVVDGRLDDPVWTTAAATCAFRTLTQPAPAAAETVVYAAYDDTALYVAFRCTGEAEDQLVLKAQAHDEAIWNDSEVELFLETDLTTTVYFHFMVNAAGVKADELDSGGDQHDRSWNPAWKAATQRTPEGWNAEIRIPWASLDREGPPSESVSWGANFARHAPALGELSTWAPVRGIFHDPERFGLIAWRADGPTARILSLGPALPGQRYFQVVLSGGQGEVEATLTRWGELTTTTHTTGRGALDVPVSIPFGVDSLAITVRAGGEDLWRQVAPLAIPDLLGQWSGLGEQLPERSQLRREWEEIGQALRKEIPSRAWLFRQQARLEALAARAGDLIQLAEWNRRHGQGRPRPYFLTTASTMVKITREAPATGELAESVEIALAKREMEGVQITLTAPETDLHQVHITASALQSADGLRIPPDQITINPVGYVEMKVHTPGAPLSGWVPDPLLPPGPIDVPAGQRQSFWITVTTRPDTPAGRFRGRLRVAVKDQPPLYLPLHVRVWNFELPLTPHLRTAFVLWGSLRNFLSDPDTPEAYEQAYLNYARFLLRHRLSPITFRSPIRREGGGYDLTWMDRYLQVAEEEGYTTFNIGDNGGVVASKDADFIRAVAEHLKARGRWERAYLYGQDEAPFGAAADLREKYGALLQAVPDLKIMQTGWSPREELQGFVQIWCPLTAGFDEAACRAAQARGEEIWWYVCIGPQRPYANFFVDYPAIDHRLLFWMNWKWNVTGFLYWGTDVWPKNDRPLEEYLQAGYSNWDPNSYDGVNGDGYLLYPGPNNWPLGSVRLANIRDGIEDYEYFYRLRELAERTPNAALRQRAEVLLTLEAPLIASRTEYTLDPALLLARRAAVAELIEELQSLSRSVPEGQPTQHLPQRP